MYISAGTAIGNPLDIIACVPLVAWIAYVSPPAFRFRDARFLREHPDVIFRESGVYVHNLLNSRCFRGGAVTLTCENLRIDRCGGLSRSLPLSLVERVTLQDEYPGRPPVDVAFVEPEGDRMLYRLSLRDPQAFKAAVDRLRSA